MMTSAMFAFIRDGQTTLYADPGGADLIARNLVWGREGLEKWLFSRQPVQQIESDCSAGAVVDCDAKAVLWYTEDEILEHPRSIRLLDQLIQVAWGDFEILYAEGMADLHIAAGDSNNNAGTSKLDAGNRDDARLVLYDPVSDCLESRSETLEEADEMVEEFDLDDEYERFAWITILDQDGSVQHRLIDEITLDLVHNEKAPLKRLKRMPPYQIPAEINVTEAICFDESTRVIRLWGGRSMTSIAAAMHDSWRGWQIECDPSEAYERQCQSSGPQGQPMTDANALGSVLPVLLMTKRMGPEMVIGEIGKSFKRLMVKLVTFFTVLFCLPFAIFALISGNWQTGAITIAVIAGLVALGFKLIESKWRRGFSATMAEISAEASAEDDDSVPVAGPIDDRTRRRELDELLRRAGMPGMVEIEPYLESDYPGVFTR